ncbi:MAG: hypothetical protein M1840_001160 [Geoglossum simile]|nr:MAG: hypothetical protein M1840_001160 [Geoglossum simile]
MPERSFTESLTEFLKSLGPYQYLFFAVLALYAPSAVSWSLPLPHFEYWFQGLFIAGLIFVGFFASKSNLAGPLRYGHHKYGPWVTALCQKAPTWTPYAILVMCSALPMSRFWVVGAVPVGWQYVVQHFHEEVRGITDKVSSACSRAALAANNAKEDAIAASRYESQALETAATALRDTRNGQGIKVTDFFEKTVEAWGAISRMADATTTAESEGSTALQSARKANNVQHPNPTTRSNAENYFELAKVAYDFTKEADKQAKWAMAAVAEFDTANRQDKSSRDQQQANCNRAVTYADKLTSAVAGTAAKAKSAAEGTEHVRWLAAQATAAALQGHMEKAQSLADDAGETLAKVEEMAGKIAAAKEQARTLLANLMLGRL